MTAPNLKDVIAAQMSATEPVSVPFGDGEQQVQLRVLPPLDWRQTAMDGMRAGSYNAWARGALHPDDVDKWLELDPTNRQVVAFFNAYKDAAGQAPGESQPSQG